jgi:hypothetical protein
MKRRAFGLDQSILRFFLENVAFASRILMLYGYVFKIQKATYI